MKYKIYDKTGNIRCTVRKLEYNGEFMGACNVTCTVHSPFPIAFVIGDYLDYRGERFYINYDPSVIKKSSVGSIGDAFVYDNIVLNSASDELTRCDFLDYVRADNKIHFSSLPDFSFFAATVKDLAERIQANLDRIYTGQQKWTVNVHPESNGKTNLNVTANRIKVWDALSLVKSTFGLNFIIRGRTITIGTSGIAANKIFKYGKGKGLREIEKSAESDQAIITRLRVYGSSKNLPYRYYNKLSGADGTKLVPDNMAVNFLMLPNFPERTLDPYLDSKNIKSLGIREGSVFFDGSNDNEEIYPSLEGMTADQLIASGVQVSVDAGDNGRLDEIASAESITDDGIFKEGDKIAPFTITLKDIGFDINKHLSTSSATISFKTGMCGGRDFEITKVVKEGNKYILTCNRVNNSSVGRYFPYKDFNLKSGDKFVLLNIEMPDAYIKAASQRLLEAGIKFLAKNDYARSVYSPKVDDIELAREHQSAHFVNHKSIYDTIKEGDLMLFNDTDLNIDASITIDSLSITEEEGKIPHFEIALRDEKVVGRLDKMQQQIDSMSGGGNGGGGGFGGGINTEQVKSLIRAIGNSLFISKTKADSTPFHVSFLNGLSTDGAAAIFNKGAQFGKDFAGGLTGVGGFIDEKGNAELDSLKLRKYLEVPELRFNRTEVIVGIEWQCSGGGIVDIVTPNKDAQGNLLNTGTVKLKLEKGEAGAVAFDDLTMGIYHMLDDSLNATVDSDDSRGNFAFAGFATIYFKITEVSGKSNDTFTYELRPGYTIHPQPMMHFACYSNRSNPERQTSAYRTCSYTRYLYHMNDWEISMRNIAYQSGDLSNLSVHGKNLEGYSSFQQNLYVYGKLMQVRADGTEVMQANDRGAWMGNLLYGYSYYDRVSHKGALWLCVAENGTASEPYEGNPAWLKQVGVDAEAQSIVEYKLAPSASSLIRGLSGETTPTEISCSVIEKKGNSVRKLASLEGLYLAMEYTRDKEAFRTAQLDWGYNGSYATTSHRFRLWHNGIKVDEVTIPIIYETDPSAKPEGTYHCLIEPAISTIEVLKGGWTDSIPEGKKTLWMSSRAFGVNIDKTTSWSTPEEVASTLYVRYLFSSGANPLLSSIDETNYDFPGQMATNPVDEQYLVWKSKPDTTTRWFAVKRKVGGIWEEWKRFEIKGEYDETYEYSSTVFLRSDSKPSTPSGGFYKSPVPNNQLLPANLRLKSFYELESNKVNESAQWECYWSDDNEKWTLYHQINEYLTEARVPISPLHKYYRFVSRPFGFNDPRYGEARASLIADGSEGKQGLQGCIIRKSEWAVGVDYRNDSGLETGKRYIDFVVVKDSSLATGLRGFMCLETHTSTQKDSPLVNTRYWEETDQNFVSILASFIIAQNASIDFMQGNELLIKNNLGEVVGGFTGGASTQAGTTPIRLWIGSTLPDNAPFRVSHDGTCVMTKADITGKINAESGSIAGFEIARGKIGYGTVDENDTATGICITDNFLRFRDANRRSLIGLLNQSNSAKNAFFSCSLSGVGNTVEIYRTYGNNSNAETQDRPRALFVEGNLLNVGKSAFFSTGYIGMTTTDVLQMYLPLTHTFFFTSTHASRAEIFLPMVSDVLNNSLATGKNASFIVYIQAGQIGGTIRVKGVQGGRILDNNCSIPNGGYGHLDLGGGDSLILFACQGDYFIMQYRQ